MKFFRIARFKMIVALILGAIVGAFPTPVSTTVPQDAKTAHADAKASRQITNATAPGAASGRDKVPPATPTTQGTQPEAGQRILGEQQIGTLLAAIAGYVLGKAAAPRGSSGAAAQAQ